MRLSGTLVGARFLLFGTFAAIGPDIPTSKESQDEAFWFGMQLLVAGAAAVIASWIAKDVGGVWCRHPRRWGSGERDDRGTV